MKFDLYVELAVRATDSRLFDLVRFPVKGAHLYGEWSARWWTRGKTKRMHSNDRDRILQQVSSEGLNELRLSWAPIGVPALIEFVKVEGADITFYPSPFSELWAEVPIHQLKSPSENRARMNFRNTESVLTRAHELPFPSTLECFFHLETAKTLSSTADLQDMSVSWIRAVMPKELLSQEVFGYACVHGTCRKMLMVMSLGFPEIDQLGNKFENIYPILIGPRASCEGLVAALGCGSVVEFSSQAPSAILTLNPKDVEGASRNQAAKPWLVPRPDIRDIVGPKVIVVPPKPKAT